MEKGIFCLNPSDLSQRIDSIPDVGNDFNHRWTLLERLYKGIDSDVFFRYDEERLRWILQEEMDGCVTFRMERDAITFNRYTDIDTFGVIGLSKVNLDDRSVLITEGVSDYLILKYLYPEYNVLGTTRLTGSLLTKYILIHLFDTVTIFSDNDSLATRNTGVEASDKLSSFLNSYNIQTNVIILQTKDILDYVYSSYMLKHK